MNNKEFIAEVARRSGIKQEHTQRLVRAFIDEMGKNFEEGESFMIPGFGTFEVKKRLEKTLINPAGQRMLVPPKLVLNFRPVASIKEKLKNGGSADE